MDLHTHKHQRPIEPFPNLNFLREGLGLLKTVEFP